MIAGLLFKDYIDLLLENVLVVGMMLLLGGVVFLFIERWWPGGELFGNDRWSAKARATHALPKNERRRCDPEDPDHHRENEKPRPVRHERSVSFFADAFKKNPRHSFVRGSLNNNSTK